MPPSEKAGAEEDVPLVDVGTERRIATTTVGVDGMTCGACTAAIESEFDGIDGVESFTISLMTNRAVIGHDLAKLSVDDVVEMINGCGFDGTLISSDVKEPPKQKNNIKTSLATTTVSVQGMTCGACTSAIECGFDGVAGVLNFTVSLITERAVAVHDPNLIPAEQIAEIIDDCGFEAQVISTDLSPDEKETDSKEDTVIFKIYGLSSDEDATRLEDALRSTDGVINALVTLSNSRAKVDYTISKTGVRNLVEVVEANSFNALLAEIEDNNAQLESLAKTKEIQEWRKAFRFSFAFAIPVFLTSMIIPMWFKGLDKVYGHRNILIPGLYLGDVVCMALTIPVQFGIGKRFYKSAWKSVRHGSATMDVLVVMGTSAAFFFSIIAMLISIFCAPHDKPSTVFDTSTMLITFITLGRYLENRAKGQTSKALSRLMSLAPSMATIYVDPEKAGGANAEERTIATELIQVGDVVILRPGDKIPADGIVVKGESYIDESMVTGEAMPILKRKGDFLIGGTVNGAGRLDFKVIRAGRDTQLSQIVKLVQEAQTSRAPIQRMADIVAGYFVPGVLTLGFVTFIGWMILSHVLPNPPSVFTKNNAGGRFMVCLKLCISVIVFACPCALGLSTPTAVMVGTGVGAENGILVKGGAALETATRITQVVLDKTGTLTKGKMGVAVNRRSDTWDRTNTKQKLWWLLVGIVESGSEHPIGKAITSHAREVLSLGVDGSFEAQILEFKAVVGRGVEALIKPEVDNKSYKVLVGNPKFLEENKIAIPIPALAQASKGQTCVYVATDGEFAGYIALSDELKADAGHAVEALRRLGIKVAMVTGDQESTALKVAKEVGIDVNMVWAGVSPGEKQLIIKELQQNNTIVAMVGDGINDSPALATADVGIAMASGTDVAMEAADIVIMRPQSLLDVPAALHLSRTIFSRIKLNLIWACVYNVIGIPFAMGFFLPLGMSLHPMAAGAAMASSSVTVVCSSLLLKYWKRPVWMTKDGVETGETGDKIVFKDSRWRWRLWKRQPAGEGYERISGAEV